MTARHEVLPLASVASTSSVEVDVDVDGADATRDDEVQPQAPVPLAAPPAAALPYALDAPTNEALEHWKSIQGKFVDDPRGSVADARTLVDELIQRIVQSFAEHREALDRQWSSEPTASTEQLRLCLHHYRALFTRLLPVVPTPSADGAGPKR